MNSFLPELCMAGQHVRLRPLDPPHDVACLFPSTHGAADREAVWQFMNYGPFDDPAQMESWMADCAASHDPRFLVVESTGTGQAIGMASYLNMDATMRRLELGNIWYVPAAHRTAANTETAFLMMRESFERLACRRVEWKCDALNERSRAAAVRLGFRYEGTFRQHMLVKERNRDTAWFAMLDDEWPRAKANIQRWLDDPSPEHSLTAAHGAPQVGPQPTPPADHREPRVITLTTDFGADSTYVGQMKGSLYALAPTAAIVDITHAIPPQDVPTASQTLADAIDAFPEGSIHIVVVDPGVGTDRDIVVVDTGRCLLVGPDNGVFTQVMDRYPAHHVVAVREPRWWRSAVSPTFHGRDIMAPVAAHLANGVPLAEMGPALDKLVRLSVAPPVRSSNRIVGEIRTIDSFGNLITNIDHAVLEDLGGRSLTFHFAGHHTNRHVRCYGEADPGELVALIGSNGCLELAVVNGNAAAALGATVGEAVEIALD